MKSVKWKNNSVSELSDRNTIDEEFIILILVEDWLVIIILLLLFFSPIPHLSL